MTMPAGKYYVGDLCYVLHDSWDEFCDITISDRECLEGEFNFKDGRRFASFSTKWGDGEYRDQFGNRYSVDAGLIGCIAVDNIDEDLRDQAANGNGPLFGGCIITFYKPFECYEDNGKIYIGDVVVDTDPLEDEYREDEEEDY